MQKNLHYISCKTGQFNITFAMFSLASSMNKYLICALYHLIICCRNYIFTKVCFHTLQILQRHILKINTQSWDILSVSNICFTNVMLYRLQGPVVYSSTKHHLVWGVFLQPSITVQGVVFFRLLTSHFGTDFLIYPAELSVGGNQCCVMLYDAALIPNHFWTPDVSADVTCKQFNGRWWWFFLFFFYGNCTELMNQWCIIIPHENKYHYLCPEIAVTD